MMSDKVESLCHVAPGDEVKVARVLNGRFDIEDCGFFGTCDHKVEKFDFTASSNGNYVEIWYCSTDWAKAGGWVVIIIILFLIYRKLKNRFTPSPY